MTEVHFLEVVSSLSLQVVLVIAFAAILARRTTTGEQRERVWTTCLLCVCGIVPGALALPHLRLLPAAWLDSMLIATSTPAFDRLGVSVLLIWGAGASLSLLRLAAAWIRTSMFLKQFTQPADLSDERVAGIWNSESSLTPAHSRQLPLLLVSEYVASPFCWQFHQPIVVFPPNILNFPERELGLIMRHELIHLSRQHPIQLFLQKLVEIAFWFHPSIWHLSSQINKARELTCDELAIRDIGEASAYLRGLLLVAECQRPDLAASETQLQFHRQDESWIPERAAAIASRTWDRGTTSRVVLLRLSLVIFAISVLPVLRVPVYEGTSRTALVSPWPEWSAEALHALGVEVRDYEPDWYSTPQHEHHSPVMPSDYR